MDSIESKIVNGQVFAEIGVGSKQQNIKFKIDTRSQVNILPFSNYQSIGTKGNLKRSYLRLATYNCTPFKTEGTINLD